MKTVQNYYWRRVKMRAILAVLILCIVACKAAVLQQPKDYDSMIEEVFAKSRELQEHKEQLLKSYYDQKPNVQLQFLNKLLAEIQAQSDLNEECIESVQDQIVDILGTMFDEKGTCLATTHKSAEEIILDIDLVISEILVDAYELTVLYHECEAITEKPDQGVCFTRFSIKILLRINDLRVTIKSIVQNSSGKFAAVAAQAEACNQKAVDKAVLRLQDLRKNVDICVQEH